jgi:hypothetical protein
MTDEQRQRALALCDRILETAAKVQADLQGAKAVIEGEITGIEEFDQNYAICDFNSSR